MHYEVVKDAVTASAFRVEAVNREGDGEVYTAIFLGPDAANRAEEYAAFKNSRLREPSPSLN